jgi:predicted DNA-binding transcriptional regulator AlpA
MTGQILAFPQDRRRPARLVTLRELADHVGFSERWVRYRVGEGMPCRRWGGRLRFDTIEVERWLEARYGAS